MKNQPFAQRFRFALAGFQEAWAREASFRTHVFCAVIALAALVILQPSPVWWALVGLIVALILAAELINSAVERLADHLHPNLHPEIKAVKDLAAGAVLVFALASLWIAGLMIFSLFTRQ